MAVPRYSILKALGYLLILPSVSAFYAMNFTGSSTFTSFSGVLKEMRKAVPAIVISIFLGIVLVLVSSFLSFKELLHMKNQYLKNVSTLQPKSDLCTGCGRCIEVCPHNVFVIKGRKSVFFDKDRCMGMRCMRQELSV